MAVTSYILNVKLTDGEKRILRALFDEPGGRLITNYKRYYPDDLRKLIDPKNCVKSSNNYYSLTDEGEKIVQVYLDNLLH